MWCTLLRQIQEEEVEKLMAEALPKNFIDYEEYPQTADIQNRCVSMIARLFNAPTHDDDENAMGTSTVGSSEAIMLGTLAMKRRWQNKRKAAGKDFSKPNIIMNSAVQVCWEKAARYFDVEERYVYCTADRYVIDPEEAVNLVDENTIGICAIIGTTYTGEYEDVKAINDLLVEKNLDCPIHVDAASGGFVAPFVVPELQWDFRLEKVISINVSGHKYGLVGSCPEASLNTTKLHRFTRELAGQFGVRPNISPKSLCSTSIILALIKHLSHSTSPKALLRSLGSTIS